MPLARVGAVGLGGGEALLELRVAGACRGELALGEVERGLGVAGAGGRLLGGRERVLALAVLVVDQPLAVGAGLLGVVAGAVALLRGARELLARDDRGPTARRGRAGRGSSGVVRRCAPGTGSSTTHSRPTSSSARSASSFPPFQANAAIHGSPSPAAHGLCSIKAISRRRSSPRCSHRTGRTNRRPRNPRQCPVTSRRSPATSNRSTTKDGSVAAISVMIPATTAREASTQPEIPGLRAPTSGHY